MRVTMSETNRNLLCHYSDDSILSFLEKNNHLPHILSVLTHFCEASVSVVGLAPSAYGSSNAGRLSERYVRLASHRKGNRSSLAAKECASS